VSETRRRARPPHPGPVPGELATEAEIAVHWPEEERVAPPAAVRREANLREPGARERAAGSGFPECFRESAALLDWQEPWEELFDGHDPPFYRWFVGGRLNASANCLDRHLARRGDRVAFHFVPEREEEASEAWTYRRLYERVNELASVLRDELGVRPGDRVTIHLPMTPALPITMLACARIGAVHSVVFAGFTGEACGRRIADSQSRILVTMDRFSRNGQWIEHGRSAERAVRTSAELGQRVDHLLLWRRGAGPPEGGAPSADMRAVEVGAALERHRGRVVAPEPMPSEAPLFLMYTSGTTGRPKGVQHGTGGYLAWVAATARAVLDIHPDDVYWCLADIGWITGHSYIVYGPLALGTSSVLYEGSPTWPDATRPWRIAERFGVTVFHTSPTAIRLLRKLDPDGPGRHATRFRVLATVGEPIEPETWRWYFEVVGRGSAAIVDTWWQTETGGVLCSTLPGLDPMKPGSTGPPVPGIRPAVLDDGGRALAAGSGRAGSLVLLDPWPGRMQTIWGDRERFLATYFARFCRDATSRDWRDWPYVTGDAALLAADGYLRILGRLDDVINVAGHRLGTKELESACLTVEGVAEAAVVPVLDAVRGKRPEVFVSLRPGAREPEGIPARVAGAIEAEIGKVARPRAVHVIPDLPKTRSGKILRRVLAGLANRTEIGDLTTLANPSVVEAIRELLARADEEREP
jgi:acetyl-CoA synthetase